MLFIIQFFQGYLKPLMLGVITFLGVYLFKKNKDLECRFLKTAQNCLPKMLSCNEWPGMSGL
jgi:hypothetical protein